MKIDKNRSSISEEELLYQLASSKINDEPISKVKRVYAERPKEVVRVTSAQQLTNEEREEILNAVSHVIPFDNDEVQYRVDPSMIAGIRVQSSSYFYDNSLKRKLNDLNGHLHKQINIG